MDRVANLAVISRRLLVHFLHKANSAKLVELPELLISASGKMDVVMTLKEIVSAASNNWLVYCRCVLIVRCHKRQNTFQNCMQDLKEKCMQFSVWNAACNQMMFHL
jgi:hypothetical protein